MKTLNTIQRISTVGKIFCKVVFILCIVGFCGCITGLFLLCFAGGHNEMKVGGVILHGLVTDGLSHNMRNIGAALFRIMITCLGRGVTAKLAENFFVHELKAGTPFAFTVASELKRLGIATTAISVVCSTLDSAFQGIVNDYLQAKITVPTEWHSGNEASVVLGVVLILGSLLCRLGAEQNESMKIGE